MRAKLLMRGFKGHLEKLKTSVLKLNYEKVSDVLDIEIRENPLEYEDLEKEAKELRKSMKDIKAEIVFLNIDSMGDYEHGENC